MNFVAGTTNVFGSPSDIVVEPRNLRLVHLVGPYDPGAKPLGVMDHHMKRCTLDRNARSLEPETELGENIVEETLIARFICQPMDDVTVGMGGGGIDIWRSVHILFLDGTWSGKRDMSCFCAKSSTPLAARRGPALATERAIRFMLCFDIFSSHELRPIP